MLIAAHLNLSEAGPANFVVVMAMFETVVHHSTPEAKESITEYSAVKCKDFIDKIVTDPTK